MYHLQAYRDQICIELGLVVIYYRDGCIILEYHDCLW